MKDKQGNDDMGRIEFNDIIKIVKHRKHYCVEDFNYADGYLKLKDRKGNIFISNIKDIEYVVSWKTGFN